MLDSSRSSSSSSGASSSSTSSRLVGLDKDAASRTRYGLLYISSSALLFGCSFVFQRHAMILQLQPITFTACRFTITTVLTCAVRFLLPRSVLVVDPPAFPTRDDTAASAGTTAKLVRWGVLCGLFVYLGSVFQQLGLQTVSAGKMSFITGSYVIFVPIFEHLLPCVPSRLTVGIWVSAAISVVGMYFLSGCVDESCVSSVGLIDVTGGVTACFLSMLCWAFLLIGTDLAVRDVDYVDLAIVEDLVVAVLSLCQAWVTEPRMWVYPYVDIRRSYLDITVVAVVEVFAVILSILGQVYVSPSLASLFFSTASVYAAVGGYVFLGEGLTAMELVGCGLIAVAIVVASCAGNTTERSVSHHEVGVDEVEASYGSVELTVARKS